MNQNIKNNRSHRTDAILRNDEYYDLAIFNGEVEPPVFLCPIFTMDAKDMNNFPLSIPSYWDKKKNEGSILENIGLTGIDNGLITYRKDRIEDSDFYNLISKSAFEFKKEDFNLRLFPVSGNTLQYIYPVTISENSINFKGGFLQGIFGTPDGKVLMLPNKLCNKEWSLSFRIKTNSKYAAPEKSINMAHPQNEGIFFFMGVRAENKFDKLYYSKKDNTNSENYFSEDYLHDKTCEKYLAQCENKKCECAIENDYFAEKDHSINGENLTTSNGFSLSGSGQKEISTENKYLWFDRTKNGYTIQTWDENAEHKIQLTQKANVNLYPLMDRTKSGYTINNISELYNTLTGNPYSDAKDLTSNAFALKANKDGSISYRLSTLDCDAEAHLGIIEETSLPGLFSPDTWFDLRVRIIPTGNDYMKIFFYINGYLKFISRELPAVNFRKLEELNEKQEGVPFNISLGGGTQGLCEMIDFMNYMKNPTERYYMEQNFCGSFIGDLQSFSFSVC